MDSLFQFAILIISIMAHEVAHGAMAYAFGDPTAKREGRLTLNPLKHIDFMGSIVIPLILILTKAGFVFGWAKPVPYNPYNLKNRHLGEFMVSIAGVATNFLIAFIFAMVLRFGVGLDLSYSVIGLIKYIVLINLVLTVFNLIPIPPLDGSKILAAVLPLRFERYLIELEKFGFLFIIIFIIFFSPVVSSAVNWLYTILV